MSANGRLFRIGGEVISLGDDSGLSRLGAQVSLVGVRRFTRAYIGPRLQGKRITCRTCDTAQNAIHAWACALRALGETVPTWHGEPKIRALSPLLHEYREYLQSTRGSRGHTVHAYRDALKLFFLFLAGQERKQIADLDLDDIQAEAVLAFLEHIESKRSNSAVTRNCRLAAIRSFVQHLLRCDVARAGQYGRILAIRTKRATRRAVAYLEPEEARAAIAAVDTMSAARSP